MTMTIQAIIDLLCRFHPPIPEDPHGSDTIKCGDPTQECTGIAVTCFPSLEVIRRTAELGGNLIIAHEPTFYNHDEEKVFLADNAVYQAKAKLLQETGIVIWRDHDHIHGGPPQKVPPERDMIFYGIMKTLGWEDYLVSSPTKPLFFQLPPTTVEALAQELLDKLNLRGVRVVGDKTAPVERVFLCEHVRGDREDNEKIVDMERGDIDLALSFEVVDWTLCEYIRDSCMNGRPRAMLTFGHFNLEEAGMQYMAQHWLPELVGPEVPCWYVQSGDSFDYLLRQ
jgi:hypothetical protein